MKLNKGLTPYPVLSGFDDDYVRGSFQADVREEVSFGKLLLDVEYHLEEPGLKQLIDEGKACYVTHIECSCLGSREVFPSDVPHAELAVDLERLADEVEVSVYIVAKEDIPAYQNEQFHYAFGRNMAFHIWQGGILAIGPEYTIQINRGERNYEQMADIFALCVEEKNPGDVWVNIDSDCLRLNVSRSLLEAYHRHKASEQYLMIQSFFVPALMSVLMEMKESGDDLASYRWYGIMRKLLQQNHIQVEEISFVAGNDKKNVCRLAQQIFKYPLQRAMEELDRQEEEGEEER